MSDPFMIKCVMCKGEFDETLLSSKRMCDPCTIQKQIDMSKKAYRKKTHGKRDVSTKRELTPFLTTSNE